jgi:predicted Na+-dependent transporter
MIDFDLNWTMVLGLVVSVLLPLVVGLVTTRMTDSGAKAALLAGLAALTGLLTEMANAISLEQPYNLAAGLIFAITSFVIAVGMHFGLYKPTGTSARLQAVGDNSHRA